jgi:hypothetical protein
MGDLMSKPRPPQATAVAIELEPSRGECVAPFAEFPALTTDAAEKMRDRAAEEEFRWGLEGWRRAA